MPLFTFNKINLRLIEQKLHSKHPMSLCIAAFHDVWRVEVVFGWRLGFILSIQTIYILFTSATAKVLYLLLLLLLLSLLNSIHWGKPQKYIWTSTYVLAGRLVVVSDHQHHYSSSSHILIFLRQTHRDGRTDGRTDKRQTHVCMYVYTATHLPNVIVSMLLQVPVSL